MTVSAHQVLRLAELHDLTLVEDDTYAWLAPPHATRLAQLDALQRTVYISGFSKILTPQWRVGFMAAAPALADKLAFAAAAALGQPVRFELAAGAPEDSPARRDAAERLRVQAAAEAQIRDDPVVRELLKQYKSARIVPGSIKPV